MLQRRRLGRTRCAFSTSASRPDALGPAADGDEQKRGGGDGRPVERNLAPARKNDLVGVDRLVAEPEQGQRRAVRDHGASICSPGSNRHSAGSLRDERAAQAAP